MGVAPALFQLLHRHENQGDSDHQRKVWTKCKRRRKTYRTQSVVGRTPTGGALMDEAACLLQALSSNVVVVVT